MRVAAFAPWSDRTICFDIRRLLLLGSPRRERALQGVPFLTI
jgi:hypothetical protein